MTALVAAPAVPAVPDIGEYLAGRYLATHKERLLDTREDKRLALLSLIDFLAPTSIVAATGAQLGEWLGDDGAGTFEFACVAGFYGWLVGEGIRADNPMAALWPAPQSQRPTEPAPQVEHPPGTPWSVERVEHFYADLLYALGELARSGGTATGAAVVVKRVALDAGLPLAQRMPLPRPTRAEYEEAQWRQAQGSAPAVLQALPSRETP